MVPGPVKKDKNNWAPRAGFAWSPRGASKFFGDGKTVFRGGFGMGYDVLFYNLLTVNASNFPRVVVPRLFNASDVYPNILSVSGAPVFDPTAGWVNSAANTESPQSKYYSFDFQRQFGNVVFQLGYTGSRSSKGINQWQMNPGVLTEAQAAAVAASRNSGIIPSVQARRLYPQFGSRTVIPAYQGPNGIDINARGEYNGMFIRLDKRYSHGLQVGGSYTFSSYMSNNDASLGEGGTDATPQIPQNFLLPADTEWSESAFDRPHRFTVNYIYEIPGFKDGPLSYVLGGWQISGITQAQSGRPFTVRTGVDSNGDGTAGSDRPNINSSGALDWTDDHSSFTNNGYFVTPLGTNGAPLQFSQGDGSSKRNGLRSAGFWNTDLSLSKRLRFSRHELMIRADSFNVFNQDNYGVPVLTLTSASFGQNTNNWGRRTFQFSGKITW